MSLKSKLQEKVVGVVWGRIDHQMAAKAPKAWPHVKRALRGWKFLAGVILIWSPDIIDWIKTTVEAAGYESTGVLAGAGTVLLVIGGSHKLVKLITPTEQRDDRDEDLLELATREERAAYLGAYIASLEAGLTFPQARREGARAAALTRSRMVAEAGDAAP